LLLAHRKPCMRWASLLNTVPVKHLSVAKRWRMTTRHLRTPRVPWHMLRCPPLSKKKRARNRRLVRVMKTLPLPQGSVSWLGVPSPLGFARRKAQTHQTTHGGPDAELSRCVSDTNQSRRSGALPHRFSGTQETPAKALSLLLIRVWDSEKKLRGQSSNFQCSV